MAFVTSASITMSHRAWVLKAERPDTLGPTCCFKEEEPPAQAVEGALEPSVLGSFRGDRVSPAFLYHGFIRYA